HLSDREIQRMLSRGTSLDAVCEDVKKIVFDRGAEDNFTAVLVRVGEHIALPASPSTDEMPGLVTLEVEESTVAAARAASPFDSKADNDDLLELETGELHRPLVSNNSIVHPAPPEPTIDSSGDRTIEIDPPAVDEAVTAPGSFSTLGVSSDQPTEKERSSFGIGGLLVGLVLGALIGVGIYYFVLQPKAAEQPQTGPISQMRTANIPLSAFEENRRNVDRDPAAWVSRFGTNPQDCEDYYLLGRAYFVIGDFDKARAAFERSRELLAEEDPVNQKTIAADIATSLVAITGTTSQTMMKKELDIIRQPANSNSSTNTSNTAPNANANSANAR
ncbi:MAG: hypothetical protein ACJ73D_10565, partial [Pyrinomonadaceae bacterium]